MTEMLTYRNKKKCPGVTNNINECSIQINWIQNVSGSHSRELDMANLNGMQPLFMLLIINYSCAFPVSTCQKQETGRSLLIGLMMALFYSSIRVSHDSVTVNNTRTLKLKQLNGIQQYFLLFLPSHVKMSLWKSAFISDLTERATSSSLYCSSQGHTNVSLAWFTMWQKQNSTHRDKNSSFWSLAPKQTIQYINITK